MKKPGSPSETVDPVTVRERTAAVVVQNDVVAHAELDAAGAPIEQAGVHLEHVGRVATGLGHDALGSAAGIHERRIVAPFTGCAVRDDPQGEVLAHEGRVAARVQRHLHGAALIE